jgi:hypothetical protein
MLINKSLLSAVYRIGLFEIFNSIVFRSIYEKNVFIFKVVIAVISLLPYIMENITDIIALFAGLRYKRFPRLRRCLISPSALSIYIIKSTVTEIRNLLDL